MDVGGTFTDAVLLGEDGFIHSAKVPSTPEDQSLGVLAAVAAVLASADTAAAQIRRLAHGMTVATNALIEGHVAHTAFVATEGFTDIVELGRQARPHLYDLCTSGPAPFAPAAMRFAAPERMTPDGPLRPLDPERAQALVDELALAAPEAIAVALLHSYVHPEHERLLGELIAKQLPATHCTLSHELVGTFREYERAATAEADAALSPLLGTYLRRLAEDCTAQGLPEPLIMQSSGGLTDCSRATSHAALTVLSGPAGGVAGAQLLATLAGVGDVLCFDMGGTSCDVCIIEQGEVAETAERNVAGRPLALPALDISTVGAGGGSIAWMDPGGALRVGPDSAGAAPGPACYGLGGTQPTVTDANLLLGRLLGDVPLAGGLHLDSAAARQAITPLAQALELEILECAEGIVRVAEAEMLRALRSMSVERGTDPRRLALMPFGGAGPLHAASLARELGIERIVCPHTSGVLSALGMATAAPRRDGAHTVMLQGQCLNNVELARHRDALIARVGDALGSRPEEMPVRLRIRHELRYEGQAFELPVQEEWRADRDTGKEDPWACPRGEALDADRLRERFRDVHEERYGFCDEQAPIELVTIRVSAWGESTRVQPIGARQAPAARDRRAVVFDGRTEDALCLLGPPVPGEAITGPAVCALEQATLLIPPSWRASANEHGTIVLEPSS